MPCWYVHYAKAEGHPSGPKERIINLAYNANALDADKMAFHGPEEDKIGILEITEDQFIDLRGDVLSGVPMRYKVSVADPENPVLAPAA